MAGAVERLGQVGHLIEALQLARPAHDGGAVPVGRGQQVIGLSGDVDERARVRACRRQLRSDDGAGRARRAAELDLDRADGDRHVPPT